MIQVVNYGTEHEEEPVARKRHTAARMPVNIRYLQMRETTMQGSRTLQSTVITVSRVLRTPIGDAILAYERARYKEAYRDDLGTS